MAVVFSTGPVHVIIGYGAPLPNFATHRPGDATSATYYGTTRSGPDITEETSFFNVMNDLAGPNLPLDRGLAGREHTISLAMTRWDGTLDTLLDSPDPAAPRPGLAVGSEGPRDRGKIQSRSGSTQLLMLLSNATQGLAADGFQILWRRYFQTVAVGPHKPIWGNKENIRVRIFKAQNVFTGIAGVAFPITDAQNVQAGKEMFWLYDQGGPATPLPSAAFVAAANAIT